MSRYVDQPAFRFVRRNKRRLDVQFNGDISRLARPGFWIDDCRTNKTDALSWGAPTDPCAERKLNDLMSDQLYPELHKMFVAARNADQLTRNSVLCSFGYAILPKEIAPRFAYVVGDRLSEWLSLLERAKRERYWPEVREASENLHR